MLDKHVTRPHNMVVQPHPCGFFQEISVDGFVMLVHSARAAIVLAV